LNIEKQRLAKLVRQKEDVESVDGFKVLEGHIRNTVKIINAILNQKG